MKGDLDEDEVLSSDEGAHSAAETELTRSPKIDKTIYERMDQAKVIGSGTFGTVFKSYVPETGENVAIKKVLQDPNFKNRELDILILLRNIRDHVNVVDLKHHFEATEGSQRDKYLYLVMGFMPCDLERLIRHYHKTNRIVPVCYTKLYMYQLAAGLVFMHAQQVCHRDLKPSNVLFDPASNEVKICDLGSAKILEKGKPNVSYIASRFYRAPELIFEACYYTTAIDIWAFGCVMGEMLLGEPVFPGESSVDQLIEIISILGTPSSAEIRAMNSEQPQDMQYRTVNAVPLEQIFGSRVPKNAVEMLRTVLVYDPSKRPSAKGSLGLGFFNDLKSPTFVLPNNGQMPVLAE